MKLKMTLAAAVATLFATPGTAQTVQVSSLNPLPTTIGAVVAGQRYTVTSTGISDLFDRFNGGLGLTFDVNGKPTYAFPAPYSGFGPNGSNGDPTQPGSTCAGGAAVLCGALIGGFSALPGGTPVTFVQFGPSYAFTAPGNGFLVGLVNDVSNGYADNGLEAFTVTLAAVTAPTPGAVPEPASWAMMILGFGAIGALLRRRAPIQVAAIA